ncbi:MULTISPECIES: 16S rRNA (uracil(1498)-N(3))-methyltransferase [Paenibacillus]|jgi:16S rRNA (uracil1498-N3)-methyltransferase|uniref:Ribosomal RNA small subunit methyltransferase E n=2 Tax=Paenibacillus TaxID=44249 RepID=A0A855XXS5_9BACL|nr:MULTISPECIES: 16S rRNA (uracil(1498)-N(3))-methyltransferase [Paenibacillus]MCZ1265577.1 16S rRNA (uracil(1498)-N(3))-methyltransferase [Paenibacillus tundrae]OAX47281.1 Ribosomal RNA small subunit methyltransferase E [Paenibacillus sp. AD87]PWW43142.1 16S rRNA (uracil1498-N3)-methyltransferase [Paenibacillus pabuli]PXW09049.1 16S rRNA (uracil1498-N3)-methyltransferase [Paenibacillus taichungensis]QLG39253.1 16S rRNA (uracil(1498)-N(3))-methyltransferase [Paenibacillus sp. E222]
MQRYFVSAEQFNEHSVVITGDDARHIGKVMRGKPGDKLIVSDGNSKEALVEIESIEAQQVTANIVEPLEMDHEARIRVTVAQSLPKGDKMETVIQRCTEIGAVSFVPFLSERTIVQYDAKKEGKRLERWRKIAKEAAEQSHRNRIPSVEQPLSWKGLLSSFEGYSLVCYCYEKENGKQLRDALKPFVEQLAPGASAEVLIVVGPEGGFSERETIEADQAGAVSVGLGKRILRAETAGMAALTCVLYESGEMGGM